MVDQQDIKRARHILKTPGGCDVATARPTMPRWMIVRQDDPRRIQPQRFAKQSAHPHVQRRHAPQSESGIAQKSALGINEDGMTTFVHGRRCQYHPSQIGDQVSCALFMQRGQRACRRTGESQHSALQAVSREERSRIRA